MNILHFQIIVASCCAFVSLTIAVAPQPVWPFDMVDPTTTDDSPRQGEEDGTAEDTAAAVLQTAQETLEAIERETFREVTEHELLRDNRQYTPRKCCKIGKKVADKGLYCSIDLMQVAKKNNGVYRRKMKFHDMETQSVDRSYKSLMLRVEKCYPSKASRSMFSKCCEWQLQIVSDLENCKYLESREARRDCKQQVRARE